MVPDREHHRMANHTINDLQTLQNEAQRHLHDLGQDQRLLRSCFESKRPRRAIISTAAQ